MSTEHFWQKSLSQENKTRERSTFKPEQAAASLWARSSWNFGYEAGRHDTSLSSAQLIIYYWHIAHTKWHSLPRFLNRITCTQPYRTPRVINWLQTVMFEKCASWAKTLGLLLLKEHTCSNFQPSDIVETICVSSSSWHCRTRYTCFTGPCDNHEQTWKKFQGHNSLQQPRRGEKNKHWKAAYLAFFFLAATLYPLLQVAL